MFPFFEMDKYVSFDLSSIKAKISRVNNKINKALFGYACIHLNPNVLKWIRVELN